MVTRYRVWLDGQGLQDIDPSIIVSDIQEFAPVMSVQTAEKASGDGMRVLRRARRSLTVAIRFYIEEYDTARRKAVLQKVSRWAMQGGQLSVSDRPDQYLQVEVDTLPAIASAQQWLGEMTVIFIARNIPYWQAEYPESASARAASGEVQLMVTSDKDVVLEAVVTNQGEGVLNTLTLAVNSQGMRFEGLGLAPGAALRMEMDAEGILRLPVSCRTTDSADMLMLVGNENNVVSFAADQLVHAVFKARGAWL